MTTFQIYDRIESLVNLPEFGVKMGDIGTVVDMHGNDAFEVDFGLDGDGNIVTAGLHVSQISHATEAMALAA